jgi:tRNA(adenine34) deaminase
MTLDLYTPAYFMKEAMKQAFIAYEEGEIPVGAVIVSGNKVIARAYNQVERLDDPTAHAEMLAITSATQFLGSKYLEDCSVYVTLEPCAMCAGAFFWTRIDHLFYGADDPKRGFRRHQASLLHPRTKLSHGLMAEESMRLLRQFFENLR